MAYVGLVTYGMPSSRYLLFHRFQVCCTPLSLVCTFLQTSIFVAALSNVNNIFSYTNVVVGFDQNWLKKDFKYDEYNNGINTV